jgi:hypothetical protein
MARKTKKAGELVPSAAAPDTAALLADLRGLIDAGRTRVAQAVNIGMVALYWGVGTASAAKSSASGAPPTANRLSRQCRDN